MRICEPERKRLQVSEGTKQIEKVMDSDSAFYVETASCQRNHKGEFICGDVFLSKKLKEEKRTLAVLADGMGHGVKANVLATLTSTMAINFAEEHKDAKTIAEIIMRTLPVCSERKTSYATFTIVDINNREVNILEYDNPLCLVMRGGNVFEPEWNCLILEGVDQQGRGQEIMTCSFRPMREDRIIFISDGVTQSGMGNDNMLLGWGRDAYVDFVRDTILHERYISASKLAQRVVNRAYGNDNFASKDDTSCGVIYFRYPRRLIIATGPPFDMSKDAEYVQKVKDFNGYKIISGATTAEIFSRHLGAEIVDDYEHMDPTLPPMSRMEGVDLVTEGVLTLNKVITILDSENAAMTRHGEGPADKIVDMLINSDDIHILVGTKINQAHHDPSLPVEIEIRKSIVKRLVDLLEKKYMKDVSVEYL